MLVTPLILFISCQSAIDNEVYGSWAVFDVYYGDTEISGIKKEQNIYTTATMVIDKDQGGEYLIHLKLAKSSNNGKNRRFTIELESKDIYIFGEKTVVSF